MSKYTIIKSGAWYDDTDVCRSAYRDCRLPVGRASSFGLRFGLDTAPPRRIVKGGSWIDDECETRSAFLFDYEAGICEDFLGLRLGLDLGQPSRAIRGGSWIDNKSLARSAYRYFRYPEGRYSSTGIRLAMSIEP